MIKLKTCVYKVGLFYKPATKPYTPGLCPRCFNITISSNLIYDQPGIDPNYIEYYIYSHYIIDDVDAEWLKKFKLLS
jgi:hypothetical protein